MLWLGQRIGLGTYQHQLAKAVVGARFNASLALGAKSALVFWPLLTSIVIVVAEVGRNRDQAPEPAGLAPEGQGAP
jgi:hypothetical protein